MSTTPRAQRVPTTEDVVTGFLNTASAAITKEAQRVRTPRNAQAATQQDSFVYYAGRAWYVIEEVQVAISILFQIAMSYLNNTFMYVQRQWWTNDPELVALYGNGMENSGNSCYLNALTQAIRHTPALLTAVQANEPGAPETDESALKASFHTVQQELSSLQRAKAATVEQLRDTIIDTGLESADNQAQLDPIECYEHLANVMKYARIGVFNAVEGTGLHPRFENSSDSPTKVLLFSVENQHPDLPLDQLLYQLPEEEGHRGVANCIPLQEMTVPRNSAPKVLPIGLQRLNEKGKKLNTPIQPLFSLKLTTQENADEVAKYRLKAVIVQRGDENAGHYVTFIPRYVEGAPTFVEFDDEMLLNYETPYHQGRTWLSTKTIIQEIEQDSCMLFYELEGLFLEKR